MRSFAPPDSRGRLSPRRFYWRKLPHLQRDNKPHFLTFCTYHRWTLPEEARSIVLQSCLHDHGVKLHVWAVVIMPDHVHMIFTPLVNQEAGEVYSLADLMDAIKGASAHLVNHALGRKGKVWQTESFDRVLRCSESLDEKIDYIVNNPVRKGLVGSAHDYRWLWVAPVQWQLG